MKYASTPALIVALGLAGCAYSNVNRVGKDGKPAPYDNLQCFEPGNNEGFSFEVPKCDCNAGIRLRYRAHKKKDGTMNLAYELERGYNNSKVDRTRIIADHNMNIQKVFLNGRELPPYKKCSEEDKMMWDSAKDSFKIWNTYEPVVKDMFRTCTEDQIYKKITEQSKEQAFYRAVPNITPSRKQGAHNAGHKRRHHGEARQDRVNAQHNHQRRARRAC